MSIAKKYHDAFVKFFNSHRDELIELFGQLETRAKQLNLDKEYRRIWKYSDNVSRDLEEFASKIGLSDVYKEIMDKVKEQYEKELGKEYAQAWGDEANKLSDIALKNKLNVIYSLLTHGAYDSAAKMAGINVEDIRGKPVKTAMSIIAKKLISEPYREVTGKLEPSERFKLKHYK